MMVVVIKNYYHRHPQHPETEWIAVDVIFILPTPPSRNRAASDLFCFCFTAHCPPLASGAVVHPAWRSHASGHSNRQPQLRLPQHHPGPGGQFLHAHQEPCSAAPPGRRVRRAAAACGARFVYPAGLQDQVHCEGRSPCSAAAASLPLTGGVYSGPRGECENVHVTCFVGTVACHVENNIYLRGANKSSGSEHWSIQFNAMSL